MRPMRSMGRWMTLVCGLATWATWGGTPLSPAAPCTLLTPAEVGKALGTTVPAGQPIADTGCSWTANQPHVTATLSFWRPEGWPQIKAPLAGVTKTPASGIGDDAIYATVGTFVTLSVKKGNVVFLVKLYGITDETRQRDVEKALALDVLKKL